MADNMNVIRHTYLERVFYNVCADLFRDVLKNSYRSVQGFRDELLFFKNILENSLNCEEMKLLYSSNVRYEDIDMNLLCIVMKTLFLKPSRQHHGKLLLKFKPVIRKILNDIMQYKEEYERDKVSADSDPDRYSKFQLEKPVLIVAEQISLRHKTRYQRVFQLLEMEKKEPTFMSPEIGCGNETQCTSITSNYLTIQILGPQGVGKTVLTRHLLGKDVEVKDYISTDLIKTHVLKHALLTDGVWSHDEDIKIPEPPPFKKVKLEPGTSEFHPIPAGDICIWDFGGKLDVYAIHQIFLQLNALFVIIYNTSKNLKDYIVDENNTIFDINGKQRWTYKDDMLFWMNSRHVFAKHAPLLFVAIQSDKSEPKEGNRLKTIKAIMKEDKKDVMIDLSKGHFTFHVAKKDTEIKDLHRLIYMKMITMPDWRKEVAANWISLFEELKHQEKKIVTFEEIIEINATTNVPISDQQELRMFLRFHHNYGNLLHFELDDQLADRIVLDVQWLIDAFSRVLNTKILLPNSSEFEETAVLTEVKIAQLWEGDRFKRYKQQLLDVMMHLGIMAKPLSCVDSSIDHDTSPFYIFPMMLKKVVPKILISELLNGVSATHTLVYRFKKFLAPLIFQRLLSLCINKWPVAKQGDQRLLFCGCCIFHLEQNGKHRAILSCVKDVIQLQAVRTGEDYPENAICESTKEYVSRQLNNILCGFRRNQQSEHEEKCDVYLKCKLDDISSTGNLISISHLLKTNIHLCTFCKPPHLHRSLELLASWFPEMVNKVLKDKVNTFETSDMQDMLIDAIKSNEEETVKYLIESGAYTNIPSNEGTYALHLAVKLGLFGITEILLEAGSFVNSFDLDGVSAMHRAAQAGYTDILLLLVSNGANVSSVDKDGNTALHYAVESGNRNLISALVNLELEKETSFDIYLRHIKLAINLSSDVLGTLVVESVIRKYFNRKGPPSKDSLFISIVLEIFRLICIELENIIPENVIKVWPAYKDSKTGPVILVAYVKDIPENKLHSFYGLQVNYRLYEYVSQEARIVINSTTEKDNDLSDIDLREMSEAIDRHAKFLRSKHSNLTGIYSSSVKSAKNGINIKPEKCIVLQCRYKGMVPFGEEEFPSKIENYNTDIREGYFTLNSSMNHRVSNPPASDRHNVLRIGCSIGRQSSGFSGTLGGFVEIDHKMHFITCCHVIFSSRECTATQNVTPTQECQFPKVCQPADSDDFYGKYTLEQRLCGKVVRAAFIPNDRAVSVDAALIEINENRSPPINEFVGVPATHFKACGFDDMPDVTEIPVMDFPVHADDRECRIFKVGATTGMTRGVLKLDGAQVFTSLDEPIEFADLNDTIHIKNQIAVEPVGRPFFDLGDSGAFVFIRKQNRNFCLGLAIGANFPTGICHVTPIKEVLDALGLPVTSLNGFVP